MTDAELAKLFFPNTRRELRVEDVGLLETSGGEKRIRLELTMSFADGKVLGMPSYIGDVVERLAKEESVEKFSKLALELDAMSLFVYTTEDHDKTVQTLYNVHITSFTVNREKKKEHSEEVPDVYLKFVAVVPSNPRLWAWLYPYHRSSIFVRFESTQPELEEKKADEGKSTEQMKLDVAPTSTKRQKAAPKDDFEADRREATSKKNDAAFANA